MTAKRAPTLHMYLSPPYSQKIWTRPSPSSCEELHHTRRLDLPLALVLKTLGPKTRQEPKIHYPLLNWTAPHAKKEKFWTTPHASSLVVKKTNHVAIPKMTTNAISLFQHAISATG